MAPLNEIFSFGNMILMGLNQIIQWCYTACICSFDKKLFYWNWCVEKCIVNNAKYICLV